MIKIFFVLLLHSYYGYYRIEPRKFYCRPFRKD